MLVKNGDLEFEITETSEVSLEGNVCISLPDYVKFLPIALLEGVQSSSQRDKMIVAAGREPETHNVIFVTAMGDLMQLDAKQHSLPMMNVDVVPIDYGHGIGYVMTGSFELSSDWAIHNAESLIKRNVNEKVTFESMNRSYLLP